jgi:hypothetical protein
VKNKETEEKPHKKIRKLGISVHILLSFEKFSSSNRLVNRQIMKASLAYILLNPPMRSRWKSRKAEKKKLAWKIWFPDIESFWKTPP